MYLGFGFNSGLISLARRLFSVIAGDSELLTQIADDAAPFGNREHYGKRA